MNEHEAKDNVFNKSEKIGSGVMYLGMGKCSKNPPEKGPIDCHPQPNERAPYARSVELH
ncbi:hypothetical protein CHS0354_038696 [Potamilus streckersoni]|uniref:Uncharacterized protein n=1 Tax=Potamilus streckersoni TaxID=2493646 RepID=A0AAE0SEZ8_9BIVA|nr:hypothetical protein CHS0354_038696 [Potamilus streckersoni]